MESTAKLLSHLHRGGAWSYWWMTPSKVSHWWPADQPLPLPASSNVYFGLHPTSASKSPHERARLSDIVALNCLFAEFDAKDFGGDKKAARSHIERLILPPTVAVDSGGGYHAYWLFPKPVRVTDANREALRHIQARWVAFVGGDPGAKDLARVLRVPGTFNSKYTPSRPVEFVWYDADCFFLFSLLRCLDTFAPEPARPQIAKPSAPPMTAGIRGRGAVAYGRAALAGELAELARAPVGMRNDRLNVAALRIGQMVAGGFLAEDHAWGELHRTALGLGPDASFSEREIQATMKSGYTAGLREPRVVRHAA